MLVPPLPPLGGLRPGLLLSALLLLAACDRDSLQGPAPPPERDLPHDNPGTEQEEGDGHSDDGHSDDGHSDDGHSDDGHSDDEDGQAFIILQHRHLNSPDWPEAFRDVRIFACNPSLRSQHLAQVREDIPGALCLAQTNSQDVPIGMFPGVPYFDSLTARFDSSLAIRDLRTGELVTFSANVPAFIMSQESADALVGFHRDITMQTDWDGFYIDQSTARFPKPRRRKLQEEIVLFDIDGDDLPDDFEKLDLQYETWRPYFTVQMRLQFGQEAIILGNSGGLLEDPTLNGITLEGVGDRFTVVEARSFLHAARAVAVKPFLSILWATTPESIPPSLELARERKGVLFGEVEGVGGDSPVQEVNWLRMPARSRPSRKPRELQAVPRIG